MTVIIRLWDGEYIQDADVNARRENYPTGVVTTCTDKRDAKRFDTIEDAWTFVHQQSTTCPLRPDGGPNMPLRSLTIQFVEEPL